MLTRDENYLSMARNVANVLKDNKSEWKALPKFASWVNELYDLLGLNSKEKSDAEIDTTGTTLDKEAAGAYAIKYANNLTKRAMNYAIEIKSMELQKQLNIHKSELERGHDSKIGDKLKDVLNRMKDLGSALNDYGVGAEHLETLAKAISQYEALLDEPRRKVRERKGHNIMALHSLSDIKLVIEKMDNSINYFEESKFEMDYQNARIVIDYGTRKGKGKGKGDSKDDNKDDEKKDPEDKQV